MEDHEGNHSKGFGEGSANHRGHRGAQGFGFRFPKREILDSAHALDVAILVTPCAASRILKVNQPRSPFDFAQGKLEDHEGNR